MALSLTQIEDVETSETSSFVAVLLILAIGAYGMFDAAFVGVVAGQRLIYAAVGISCLIAIVAGIWQLRLSSREMTICVVFSGCVVLWLMPVVVADRVIAVYIAGDIASLVAPIGLLLAGMIYPEIFRSRMSLALIGTLLVLALFVSIGLSGGASDGRFEPPHDLLLALLWLSFLRFAGGRRLVSSLLLVLALIVTLRSGERASTVLWLYGGMYIAALTLSTRRLLIASLPVGILSIFFVGSIAQDMVISALQETRFSANLDGQVDDSLLSRVSEAQDAINDLRAHGEPINYLLGFGHGATFVPVYSSLRNAVADGVVHNIHIGPVLIIYRYGLIGLGLYLFLIFKLFKSFLDHRQRIRDGTVSMNELFFTLAATMYLLDGLVFNVLVDPGFSFAIAGFLYYSSRAGFSRPTKLQLMTR